MGHGVEGHAGGAGLAVAAQLICPLRIEGVGRFGGTRERELLKQDRRKARREARAKLRLASRLRGGVR